MESKDLDELEIGPEEVEPLIGNENHNTDIVDVREESELAGGILPGAIHVPMSRFQEHIPSFTSDRRYVIYCAHGVRSLHVAEWLCANKGVSAKSMRGGFADWNGPIASYNGGTR